MLPVPNATIGGIEFPTLPPQPSGPVPSTPGSFSRMFDRLQTEADRAVGSAPALPTAMEVRPLIEPAASLATPFKASPEFPGAVDPNGLRVPGQAAGQASGDRPANPFQFLSPLKGGLDQVNSLLATSDKLTNEAAVGGDVDLHDVMIAAEKAGVAMQLTLQVRNKLVEAYQDVMRMQV